MHNKFIDKRRRFINFRDAQVGNILPEHFAASYPKFISLLEKYYEFQDQNNSTELLNHLFASRDINETDITLLTFIEDELLLGEEYFEGFTGGEPKRDVELRAAANFSNILFRSKGSKFAIEWFFRTFYGEEVEVLYPKENIFNIGERDSLLGPDSLKYITDDKLYQTFALLIRIGIPISKWRDVFKLFAHPAGMYLGGEVLITDEIDPNITTPTDIISQYTTPNYFITTTASVDEGDSLTVFANGNNVQNGGTSYLYWYGAHVTTNDSDFGANFADDPTRLGLPDSNEAQYVPVNSSVGVVSVKTVIDPITSPAEGDETFKVYLRDKNGFVQDSATITLNDVVESYLLGFPSFGQPGFGGQFTEGEGPFTIDVIGTNVPNGGETTIFWYIDSAGAGTAATFTADDLEEYYDAGLTAAQGYPNGYPDSAGNAVPIAISGAVGAFTLDPRVDGVSEGNELVVLRLTNANGVPVGSGAISIINQDVSYTVTVNDFTEGNDLVASITSGTYNADKVLKWQIEDSASIESPLRMSLLKGEVTLDANGSGSITIPSAFSSGYNIGTRSVSNPGRIGGTLTVYDSSFSPTVTGSDTFDIVDEAPVYTLTASPIAGSATGTTTFTIGGTNIPPDDVFFYVDNAPPNPTSDNDFNPDPPPRDGSRRTVSGGLGATTDLTFSATAASGNDEDFIAYIYDQSTGGTELAELSYTILQSGVSYSIETLNTSNVTITNADEGDTVRFRFNAPAGNYYYWFDQPGELDPTGPSNASRQLLTVPGTNTIDVDLIIEEDFTVEGSETLTVFLSTTTTGGAIASKGLTINDTSLPSYDIGAYASTDTASTTEITSRTEDQNLIIGVEALSSGSTETIYVELSGAGASTPGFTTTQKNGVFSSGTNTRFEFVTNGDNGLVEADRTVTATVTVGDYASGSPSRTIGTVNVTITDAATQQFGLFVSSSTPSPRAEGTEDITMEIVTENVADGTAYYVRPVTDMVGLLYNVGLNSRLYSVDPYLTEVPPNVEIGWSFYVLNPSSPGDVFKMGNVTNITQATFTIDGFQSAAVGIAESGWLIDPDLEAYFANKSEIMTRQFVMTSNFASESFDLQANNNEFGDRTILMGMTTGSTGLGFLDTEPFTITDASAGADGPPNVTQTPANALTQSISSTSADADQGQAGGTTTDCVARHTIRFKTNGDIEYVQFTENDYAGPGDATNTITVGTWIDNPAGAPGNYEVELTTRLIEEQDQTTFNYTIVPNQSVYFTGDFETPLSLSTQRAWVFETNSTGADGLRVLRATLGYTVRKTGTTQFDTTGQFTLTHTTNGIGTFENDGGAGEPDGGDPFGCFLAGTQITLADGTMINVEDIEPGTDVEVLGQNGVTNIVLGTMKREGGAREVFNVNEGLLEMTPGHPILTTEGWASARQFAGNRLHPELDIIQLEVGQELIMSDGSTTVVTSLTSVMTEEPVYNIDVTDGDDTYIANGVVVHNK